MQKQMDLLLARDAIKLKMYQEVTSELKRKLVTFLHYKLRKIHTYVIHLR